MIYISTGGFKSYNCIKSIKLLVKEGLHDIELSGGKYEINQIRKLKAEKISTESLNLQVHNYFPPPKIPFVFNLASLDENIAIKK